MPQTVTNISQFPKQCPAELVSIYNGWAGFTLFAIEDRAEWVRETSRYYGIAFPDTLEPDVFYKALDSAKLAPMIPASIWFDFVPYARSRGYRV
jgi:hypothetical protein